MVIEILNLDKQNDAIKATPTNTDTWNDSGNYSTTAPQGSGTEADPYLISTAKELAWISVNYAGTANGKYFLQTANIDLGAHYWVPINNSSAAHAYYYDGGNHTISNLYINATALNSSNYIGLFGCVSGSENNHAYIRKVGIINGTIISENSTSVGAVVGYSFSTDITNCYNQNTNITGGSYVGGVVGYNDYGTVSDSYSTGIISGNERVGGVVGSNTGMVSNSYSIEAVSGLSNYVGGVTGYNVGTISKSYNEGTITGTNSACGVVGINGKITSNSYNIGKVTGLEYVGGIIGNNSGTVSNSYNIGTVSGAGYVGGVAGYVRGSSDSSAIISSCFSAGEIIRSSGSETSFGGVVGYIENRSSYPAQYVSISWCYYNKETSGNVVTKAIGSGTGYQCYGLTTTEMQGAQNENWMYLSSTYWNFASGQYPTLKYVAKPAQN